MQPNRETAAFRVSTALTDCREERGCPHPALLVGDDIDSTSDSGRVSTAVDVSSLHRPRSEHDPFPSCPRSAGAAAAGAALDALSGPWHLAVLDGPDLGLVVAIGNGTVLGRGEVLSDPLVSRRHLRLRLHGGRVLAQDCGSANGTYRYWRLGLWLRLRREVGLSEGALLRLGDSVLELRGRPADLVVPAPESASSMAWSMVGSLICVLVMAGSAAIAITTGSRGAMTIMRLVPFLQRRRGGRTNRTDGPRWRGRRRRRRCRPGWSRGRPDPAMMLLALAARYSVFESAGGSGNDAESDGSATASTSGEILAAWTSEPRRRYILSLADSESLALVGKDAESTLRWWCAQLLARDEVRVTELDDLLNSRFDDRTGERDRNSCGVRLTWGPRTRPHCAQILICPGDRVPPQALNVRPAPAGAPSSSPVWWDAVRHLCRSRITSRAEPSLRLDGVPDLVRLSEVIDDLDDHELRARWQEQMRSPAHGASSLSAILGVSTWWRTALTPFWPGPRDRESLSCSSPGWCSWL